MFFAQVTVWPVYAGDARNNDCRILYKAYCYVRPVLSKFEQLRNFS